MASGLEKQARGVAPLFELRREPTGFLNRLFTTPQGGRYRGTKIAYDQIESKERIATPLKPKDTKGNYNDAGQYKTIEVEPPNYNERAAVNLTDIEDNRQPGQDQIRASYNTAQASQVLAAVTREYVELADMIERSIEVQASQIFQTGALSLSDKDSDVIYTNDFAVDPLNFFTAAVPWSNEAGAKPVSDLNQLATQIRNKKGKPGMVIMGATAFNEFLETAQVKERADVRRFSSEIINIDPRFDNSGATFQGSIGVGHYKLEIWTYDATFDDPVTGTPTQYVADDKVIMLSPGARLDRYSASTAIPISDPSVARFAPSTRLFRGGRNGFDFMAYTYVSEDRQNLISSVAARTLLVPVHKNSFGAITV